MPLLNRQKAVAAAAEGTPGTAAALSAAGYIRTYNAKIEPDIDIDERPGPTGLGRLQSVNGGRRGRMTFDTDIVGKASLPTWATVLLPACGLTNTTGTFAFTNAVAPITIGIYTDGILEKLVGAVGTPTFTFESGKFCKASFEFIGKYVDDADVTFPTITDDNTLTLPPRWTNNAVTVHSVTPLVSRAVITCANEMILREDATDALKSGYLCGHIVDRKPTLELDPEAGTIATKDWSALVRDSTEGSFSIALGTAANNIMTFSGSKAQPVDSTLGDRNKLAVRNLKFQLNGATPFQVVFS